MRKILLSSIVVLITFSSCNQSNVGDSKQKSLSGAGATFPLPFYNIVFKNFSKKTNSNVTYGGVGSGGGIRSLRDKVVDFGATDTYLSDAELKEMSGDIVHIPTAIGGVVLSYNLKEISELKLTSELITEIYLGKIVNWNDPKIKSVNQDLDLPNKKIIPIHRSDGSGTTFIFSDFLSKTNANWEEDMGTGKSLKWKAGIAAKGNPGIAGVLSQTDGAIGYLGSEYALAMNIPMALIQNSSGNFIKANPTSISNAAKTDIPADTRILITNSSDPDAYPISSFTWIIVYKEQNYTSRRTREQALSLINLLHYVISKEGQDVAIKTHYAPLSDQAVQKSLDAIKTMTYDHKPLLP